MLLLLLPLLQPLLLLLLLLPKVIRSLPAWAQGGCC
jgi:hypothetical protein